MLKKISALIIIFNLFSSTYNLASDNLSKFLTDVNKYYPHPSWITKDAFLKMDIQEFEIAFVFLVKKIFEESTRWHYLYDSPNQFLDDDLDRVEFLEHLKLFDDVFSKLAINQDTYHLELFEKEVENRFRFKNVNYIPLREYLKSSLPDFYFDFYALYFKYLSEDFFYYCIKYKQFSNQEKRSIYLKICNWYDLIEKVYTKSLIGSKYEKEALRQFERYENVLAAIYEI